MYKHIVGLQEKRMKMANVDKALQEAARRGLLDVFETINNANPSILRLPIAFGVFNVAVRYRHRNIFSLLQRIPSRNAITNTLSMTKTGEMYSIVQHAALLAPANHLSKIPGPALQMKSELEWFEEVKQKSTVYPRDILEAEELFTKEHKELKSAGEKWMKDTATACSLVGSLIITIMFAVALTVPGGSLDKDEGLIRAGSPILLNDKWFTIFVTFDVISLLSATCSVLIFLAILTSRYGEKDFLTSLPTKLMTGLIFLFLSIATMTVTFCSALVILLRDKHSKSIHYIFVAAAIIVIKHHHVVSKTKHLSQQHCRRLPRVEDGTPKFDTTGWIENRFKKLLSDLKRMFEAIENNEEEEVIRLIGVNRDIVRARHPFLGETALHHAVSIGKNIGIVRILVESMDREDLEIKDRLDMNALGLAVRTGITDIAKCLVEKNNNLVDVCNDERLPVELALQYAQKEMGRYLYVATPMLNFVGDNREHGASVITLCIVHSLPEIALHLLHHHPELAIAQTIHSKHTPIYRFSTDISDALCNLSSSDTDIYDGTYTIIMFWDVVSTHSPL
ncbi:hypothetical protein G4B88_028978 [Cannabis sativa]|uniref:PGG domain-containing protein n=1 Tax=Cannabis sativa TaxID=3483 RepID=A0A7J6HN11_CANSA|nr:hypothetical protein G4B88_028978 [Cannabis sativa]